MVDIPLGKANLEGTNMPPKYRPDRTEGITKVEDLPAPKILRRFRAARKMRCPKCGYHAYRDKTIYRRIHDLGDPKTDRPVDLEVICGQYYCSCCDNYFNGDLTDLTDRYGKYTRSVMEMAIKLVVEDGIPYRPASWHLWRDHRVFVPWATIQNWVESAGKKISRIH